jgi:DNA mismatch repair protein MSH4
MLKNFVQAIPSLFEALQGARSELLVTIRENCRPWNIDPTIQLIKQVINDDVRYQKTPLDLRNQRTYAVKVIGYLPLFPVVTDSSHSLASVDYLM